MGQATGRRTRRSGWLALALLLAAAARPAPAEEGGADGKHARAEELERRVRHLRALEARYRSAVRSVLGDIDALGQELALADSELALLEARIEEGEAERAALEARAGALAAAVDEQRQALRRSLLRAHALRAPDWLTTLLSAPSPAELARNLRRIGLVSELQSASIERFRGQRAALEATRRAVAARNSELGLLRDQREAKRAEAARHRARKQAFLAETGRRRDEAVRELRRAAAELSHLVGDLGQAAERAASTGFAGRRGSLPWPVEAEVIRGFGVERHPRFHTLVEHPGLDFAAPSGTPVRAIHAGVVAFADWFKGYGLLVVVDHGDGFYSLYAHLLELRVSRSTRVSGGSLVGLSGESGSLEGPRLYFEIRQGERPLDPRAWLALRRR